MSTYGIMQDRIADELHRTDLTSQIQLAIISAIQHYESKQFWFNETRATASTIADQEYYELPLDFVEMVSLKLTDNGNIHTLTERTYEYIENAMTNTSYTGEPTDFAMYGDLLRLYPIPDAVYTLTISYKKTLADLSATADTNAWMTNGEELIRARAKADLKCGNLEDESAMQERQLNYPFFNSQERSVYMRLVSEATQRASSGRLTATNF